MLDATDKTVFGNMAVIGLMANAPAMMNMTNQILGQTVAEHLKNGRLKFEGDI